MNGIHDLGGMHGFGPVVAEPEDREPPFHEAWEGVVCGMMLRTLSLGRWSLDRFRFTIESSAPVDYLSRRYFENWFEAVQQLAVEEGLVTEEELASGVVSSPVRPVGDVWRPVFAIDSPARHRAGDQVRAVNRNPAGHTRQPRYVRGKVGTVVRVAGAEPLPEAAAEDRCEPQHLYLVRFEAAELWGAEATAKDALFIELWDDYLEPVA